MCLSLGNLDSGSFCIWDVFFPIHHIGAVCYRLWHLAYNFSRCHYTAAFCWHMTLCLCSQLHKALGVLDQHRALRPLYTHLAFFFSEDRYWLPASPLICIRGSDWHRINLLFSFLNPTHRENQYSFKKKAQERTASGGAQHHFRNMVPLPNSND